MSCNPIRSYFCLDWSQTIGTTAILGGGAGIAIGVIYSNTPLTILSSSIAVLGGVLNARVACLKPWADAGETANDLEHAATLLGNSDQATERRVQSLKKREADLLRVIEQAKKENEELQKTRENSEGKIKDLESQLEMTATSYRQLQEQALQFHKAVSSDNREIKEVLSEEKAATGALNQSSAQISDIVTIFSHDLETLNKQKAETNKQITEMHDLIEQLKKEEAHFQLQIEQAQKEKEALQSLIDQEKNAEAVQHKIDESTKKLDAVNAKMVEMMAKLAVLQR